MTRKIKVGGIELETFGIGDIVECQWGKRKHGIITNVRGELCSIDIESNNGKFYSETVADSFLRLVCRAKRGRTPMELKGTPNG